MPSREALHAEKARRVAEQKRIEVERDASAIRDRCYTLAGFVREAWPILEPSTTYVHGWHIDAICQHLEAVTAGSINRLLINVPPGSSKSLIVSVLWPAWEWGPRDLRSLRFLTTSFAEGNVKRDTRKHRDLTLSDWYQALWPKVALTRTAEMSFANDATGTREGVAFGSLTSRRGDRLIIDDPHSIETAESEVERSNTVRLFREGATNRLNDQQASAIVVVMQRLHEKDISGTILDLAMGYEHLCLAMELEPGQQKTTSIGFQDPRTKPGELLDPIRFPASAVKALQRDMGSYAYAGQYQQRPVPREGGLFKRHWFEIVRAVPAGGRYVRAWDLAATKGGGDYTAGVLIKVVGSNYYVVDVIRFQGSPNEVDTAILNAATQDTARCGADNYRIRLPRDPGQAGVSQRSSHAALLSGFRFRSVPVSGSKETRATPLASQVEAGNVKVLQAEWTEAFLDEIGNFPNAAYDDQVDAVADAFSELVAMPDVGAIIAPIIVRTSAR